MDKTNQAQQKIVKKSEKILEFIDLDNLMANPQAYMSEFNKQFFESLDEELQEAIKAGEEKAYKMIKNIK